MATVSLFYIHLYIIGESRILLWRQSAMWFWGSPLWSLLGSWHGLHLAFVTEPFSFSVSFNSDAFIMKPFKEAIGTVASYHFPNGWPATVAVQLVQVPLVCGCWPRGRWHRYFVCFLRGRSSWKLGRVYGLNTAWLKAYLLLYKFRDRGRFEVHFL